MYKSQIFELKRILPLRYSRASIRSLLMLVTSPFIYNNPYSTHSTSKPMTNFQPPFSSLSPPRTPNSNLHPSPLPPHPPNSTDYTPSTASTATSAAKIHDARNLSGFHPANSTRRPENSTSKPCPPPVTTKKQNFCIGFATQLENVD